MVAVKPDDMRRALAEAKDEPPSPHTKYKYDPAEDPLLERNAVFGRLLASQIIPSEATAHNLRECLGETGSIVVIKAIVEPESLLINVARQAKRLDGYIRSLQRPLEQ